MMVDRENRQVSWQKYGVDPRVAAFLKKPPQMFVDGKWCDAENGETFRSFDPATGMPLTEVPAASAADVGRAVKAAQQAFEGGAWPSFTPAARQQLLFKLADRMEADRTVLAEIETIDNGKPLSEALGSVDATVEYIRYMAGWATKVSGRTTNVSDPTCTFAYTRREAVGVVGAIIPWNFPISMAAWKIVPPLAVGCTVVLKPAEQTPLSSIYLASMIEEVGYPAGVFNLVTGVGSEAGAALASHPDINKVAFTGSTPVGKMIAASAAQNLTRVTLELGGKSPVIVLEDCDVQKAAEGAAGAVFYNQGQICCAGSRLYVQRKIYDKVVADAATIADGITLAPGLAPDCMMGPLVSRDQHRRVSDYIDIGCDEGAVIANSKRETPAEGYFVRPTILADTSNDMRVVREEIFGPVLVAAPFDTIDEVIEKANDTPYGLGASVWSNDLSAVNTLVPQLKAGNVWINTHNLVVPSLPFGGMKASGYGRELGSEQLDAYLETKSVWIAN